VRVWTSKRKAAERLEVYQAEDCVNEVKTFFNKIQQLHKEKFLFYFAFISTDAASVQRNFVLIGLSFLAAPV
jgi:hypothetical protein